MRSFHLAFVSAAFIILSFQFDLYLNAISTTSFVLKGHISTDQYLLPVLLFGPNNQLVGLKQAAFLAWKLDRVLVIPPFEPHYMEETNRHVSARKIIDIVSTPYTPKIVFLEDFIRDFTGSSVEATVFLQRKDYENYLERIVQHFKRSGIDLSFSRTVIPPRLRVGCSENRRMHENFVFKDKFLVLPIYKFYKECNITSMRTSIDFYNQFAAVQLKKSLREEVKRALIGKLDDCFVCAHFRPIPDEGNCLSEWGMKKTAVPSDCKQDMKPLLWYNHRVKRALRRCPKGNRTFFASFMPKMNSQVMNGILNKYNGITLADIFDEQNVTNFQVSLMEQMVCSLARFFVPSLQSSWSTMVHEQRILWASEFNESQSDVWKRTFLW